MANGQELVRIKSNGKLHFPKNIPRERTGVAYKWMYMTWAVLLPAALWLSPRKSIAVKVTTIAVQLAGTLALLTGVEIFRRICYALEERNYLYSRYNNNYNTLFYRIFSLSPRCTKIVGLSAFTLAVLPFKFDDMFATKDDLLSYIPTLVSVLLVSPTLQLDHCPHNDSLKITQKRSSDYGSSMAHSFFHGYLKIVLPADGHSPLNIKDLMERYESRHNIKFQTHKLYILVPLSLECPNEIGLSGNMEPCKTLDSIKKDVAGVKDRTYHNSVYKIKTDKVRDPIYACVEYATPLRTLYYSLKSNTDHADFYREHIKDIIWNFYVNTTELIESDMDTKGLCELLYYDDKNVGDIGEMLAIKIIKERYRLHQNQP